MSIASRISKKTFFAAAVLGLAAAVPAQAYLFEEEVEKAGGIVYDGFYENYDHYNVYILKNTYLQTNGWNPREFIDGNLPAWLTFVKTGSGTAQMDLGAEGDLYNQHLFGYSDDNKDDNDGPVYKVTRKDGSIPADAEYEIEYYTAGQTQNILDGWKSGEIVVDQGTLSLGGLVNMWYDFGSVINSHEIGQATGKMIGVSRITVRNGATLDLSANNSFISGNWNSAKGMVASNSLTTLQFLNNLQAGDLGTDLNSELVLGSASAYHINLNVGGWEENTRVNTGVTLAGNLTSTYFDDQLAFGGSIGRISGAGSIYKTGKGTFTLLNSSTAFTGSLYAAGGSLVLAGSDSGAKTKAFTDGFGNNVRVLLSSSVGNAASVNIAGTMNTGKEANGGSMQGSAIGSSVHSIFTKTTNAEQGEELVVTAVKEAFFTTPEAGTLVIAENQTIKNLQSYFAAGLSLDSEKSAAEAVIDASNSEGVLAPKGDTMSERGTADAPIIAGTGIGSKIVIPGGNYTVKDGKFVQNVDANGYMQGGVLVVNQTAGMGGVYQGAVVGARVSIYNKNTFEANTEKDQTTASLSNADRLKAAQVTKDTIKTELNLSDDELASLNIGADGAFALDNPVAWKVVNYYKQTTLGSAYYVDYKADDTVVGGLLVLEGAGDLALLLETANYSGIYIDPNRTGKTVLNISAVNSLPGSTVSLGGRGIVSFVATQGSTLDVKLSGFAKGSQLVFATTDTVQTVSGVVSVGGNRQADIGFAQIQDGVYGDIFIESGIGLNLSGNESVFANADTVTLWKGKAWKQENAAPTLTLFPKGSTFASQVVNDLTGDASAEILLGNGILTTVVSDNGVDLYSGLTRGAYAGKIIGSGSIIKDGEGTFTLSGGENNRNFTGTTEITAGKLSVTRTNSLTGTSAIILNEGTVAEMSGDQKIRTLYGSAGTSVAVEGKLTLGANVVPASGENRTLVTNNLGLGAVASGATDASFARFKNCFDLEGNLVLENNRIGIPASQKDATEKYLTATAKLAYSGFEVSALEKFVGVKDYDGSELISQADYDTLKAFAKNGGTGTAINGVAQTTLLADLAEKYAALAAEDNYLKLFAPTGTVGEYGWYSPSALKSLFPSEREYKVYVSEQLKADVEAEYGKTIPANPTLAEKDEINKALFKVLRTKYETLSDAQSDAKLKANPAAMFAEFKTAKNLAGTPLMSEADIAAVDALLNAENPDAAAIKAAYETWSGKYEAVRTKELFAGIAVPGAFAAQVTVGGDLTNTSWISEPSFAGTLTAGMLVKTGDSTVDLTGNLSVNSLIIEGGQLGIEGSSLAAPIAGGISVSRNADLSVNVNANPEDPENVGIVFNQSVSGDGNFVKTGAGKLTLGKDVLYTGTTTIAGGTLEMTLREVKTAVVDGVSKTILPQSHIYFAGNHTTLILDQPEDIVWAGEIKAKNGVEGSGLTKLGDGELTVNGDVVLGRTATLSVLDGSLNLSSVDFGVSTDVYIAKEAALTIGKTLMASGGTVRYSGAGALRISGAVSLFGVALPGDDKFVGTVTVQSGGALTLRGLSVFPDAQLVVVNSNATLSVIGSTQRLNALAGAGTLSLGTGATLELNSSESRIGMTKTAGFYTFNEEDLLAVPDFSGSVVGEETGILSVVEGVSSFSGAVDANVLVKNGGQVVLNAAKFGGNNTATAVSTVTADGADSEVVFLVSDAGTANLSTGAISFTANGGKFGKVGNGTLSVSHNDFANCSTVSVYDGTLNISGWIGAKKVIASGATLAMTIGDTEPDFSTVYGSGTLELTATKDVTLSPDKVNVTGTNEFFNGEIRFASSGAGYKVTLAAGTNTSQMVAVSTGSGVSLNVGDGVTFIQSQNSEIAGDLEVSGTVKVQGLDAKNGNSGRVLSSDFRSLTLSGDYTRVGNSEFKMLNIGFGFKSTEADMSVVIDKSSVANAFIVDLAQNSGTLVAAGTTIGVDAKINDADASSALKELSVIKTGDTAAFTLSAATIVNDLGSANTTRDSVFGISRDVYSVLEDNNGLLNLGVGEGKMVVEWSDDCETLTTANGVDVNLVTLRDAASGNSGTLTIKSTASSSRALAAGTQVFAETVRGGGNVTFDGTTGNGLVVSAKQEYLGQTEIAGNVEFSGEGRNNASSQLTVAGDATLHGGVNMNGRNVGYSVNAVRNADDTGAAGTTTLTIALSDARLASDIKAQVKVRANGTLDTATWEILGTPPAGVTIDPASLKLEDGVLTLTATDAALNEDYTISVNTGTLPSLVGGVSGISGKTTVAGNVILENASKVILDATDGDSISVGAGTVTINSGSSIYVENLGTETLGKTLKLVSAGTVTDGAATNAKTGTAAVVAALKNANGTRTDAEKMKLAVYTDANGDVCAKMIIDDFAGLGADYNEGVSDSFLDSLSEIASWNGANIVDVDSNTTLTGSAKDLFFALNSLPEARLADEVEKLSPISFASMLAMPVAAFNSDVARIHGRLDQRRYDGADPLRDSGEYEFFALAQSDFAENGTAADAPNFDYNLYGVTAGFDWKPSYETTLGFALGYTYGKAKVQNGGGKINMDDMRATAFASRLFGNCYVDAGVQAGTATFDTRRQTVAGAVSGDTDSVFAGTFVTVGSVFSIWQDKKDGSGLYFTPSVGLSYLHTEIDGFTESGTAGLDMDDTDGDSLRARIAAALQWAFPLDSWQVRLGVEVAYSHDFLGDELDMTGRFAAVDGSKFSTSGKALPTDIFSFGPTVDIMVSERSSLYFGYGIDVDTDSGVSQNVNAGFRHRF